MATLFHEPKSSDGYSLEITPLRITPAGSEDGYELTLRLKNQILFSQASNGHNGEMGHYYLTTLAEAFREARNLIETQLVLENVFGQPYCKQASVEVGTPFAAVYLTGFRTEEAEWIDVDLFLCPDWSRAPEGLLCPYFRAFLRTSLPSAERFGTELIRELDEITAVEISSASEEENDASGCP